MITIIDYGMGNLGSILNMLRKIGADAVISSSITDIEKADKLILPGVGAFDAGMRNLAHLNLIQTLKYKVLEKKTPILGICLGMQLMTEKSEEGNFSGLGWFKAETKRFSFNGGNNLKIPHMGWNYLSVVRENNLFRQMAETARFYFVHSYHAVCRDPADVIASTFYGYDFVSSVNRDNIYGVQFHPEKSHKYGMKVLRNFAENV